MSLGTAASIGMQIYQHRQQIGAVLQGATGLAQFAKNDLFGKIFNQLTKNNPAASTENPGELNTLAALGRLHFFDADHNGQVTQLEITEGLGKLDNSGLNAETQNKLKQLGQNLLQHYQSVAALDGNGNAISYGDLGRLAYQDGQWQSISSADWQKLS